MILRDACKRGLVDLRSIQRSLGVPEYKVQVAVAKLLASGVLEERRYSLGSGCDRCPLKKICGGSCPTGRGAIVFYRLTRRGLGYVSC